MRQSTMLQASCVIIAAVIITIGTLVAQGQFNMSGIYADENREQAPDTERLRRRLAGEPLQAEALRNLALRSRNRRGLLRLAQKVSRRDPVTQALLLDEARQSGSLAEKLRHYDILMSIAPQTGPALLPGLAATASQPGVIAALEPYAGRPWLDDFLVHIARQADTGDHFLTHIETHPFLIKTMRQGENFPNIIRTLAARGEFDAAFKLADLFVGGDRSWKSLALTKASTDPRLAPLTWQTQGHDNQGAAQLNGVLAINLAIQPSIEAPVLRRYTQLASGTHLLTIRLTHLSPARPHLHWSIRCASQPLRPLASHRLPVAASTLERMSVRITIPEACSTQIWELQGTGTDSNAPSRIRIDAIRPYHANDSASGDSPVDGARRP